MSNENRGAQADATNHAAPDANAAAAGGPAGTQAARPLADSMGSGAGPAEHRPFRRALVSFLRYVFAYALFAGAMLLLIAALAPPTFPQCEDPAILPRVTRFASSQFSHQRGRPVEARFTTSPKMVSKRSRPAGIVKHVYFRVCEARVTVEGVAYDYQFGMREEGDDDEGFLLEPPR